MRNPLQRRFLALVVWLMLAIVLSSGVKLSVDSPFWWVLVAAPAVLMLLWLAGGFVAALSALALSVLRSPGRRS